MRAQSCSLYIFYLTGDFFWFKQTTAYDRRISDWSSDVCSSDLRGRLTRCRDSQGRIRTLRRARRRAPRFPLWPDRSAAVGRARLYGVGALPPALEIEETGRAHV